MERPLVGLGIIAMRDGKVLLAQRQADTGHGVGTWCMLGGHLEFGESWEECSKREAMEEAGLELENIRLGPVTNDIFKQDGKHYVTLFMLADCPNGDPQIMEPHKLLKWEWFDWDDMPTPLFQPIINLKKTGFNPFN